MKPTFKAEVLFLSRAGKKHGIGHLKRTLRLMHLTDIYSVCVVLSEKSSVEETRSLILNVPSVILSEQDHQTLQKTILELDPKLCVTDLRETPQWLTQFLTKNFLPVIAMDDYGTLAQTAEVTVCPLPHPHQNTANFSESHYIPPEPDFENYHNTQPQEGSILLTFGGSDPADLGQKIGTLLLEAGRPFTLIQGPLSKDVSWAENSDMAAIIESPESLLPYLATHETIFTTVGMTLIETLNLGRKVILVHPTAYHAKLGSYIEKVIDIGEGSKLKKECLFEALNVKPHKNPQKHKIFDFVYWWNELTTKIIQKKTVCPVCKATKRIALERREHLTLFECKECGSNYQYVFGTDKIDYESDYFENRYHAAYGKTYKQDFEDMRLFARRRLRKIRKWIPKEKALLVDVGSAMGVFAHEAINFGFEARGVEVSHFATRYARKHFGLIVVKQIEDIDQNIDVITLWFTLEHFDRPDKWLENAVSKMSPGAVLCLGLPNGEGGTARLNRKHYLTIRPEEHRIEPSIRGMKKLLKDLNFEILDVQIFGLHPERFGLPDWEITRNLQQNLKWGDTFEIYARKK